MFDEGEMICWFSAGGAHVNGILLELKNMNESHCFYRWLNYSVYF